MMMFKLGFRNLMRNRRRSFLTGLAVGLGLASMILADGFWAGMLSNMVSSVTSTYIGDAQVHHGKFIDTQESKYFIKDTKSIEAQLRNNSNVEAYSSRTLSLGMITSSTESKNVRIMGVNPYREAKVSLFDERILSGKYIEGEKDLIIGERLRERLDARLGDRLVLTVSDLDSGEIQQDLFRLSGVYGVGTKELDEHLVLVHFLRLQKLLGAKGTNEIAIKLKNSTFQIKNFLKIESPSTQVKTWKELVPQVVAAIEMSNKSIGILGLILFLLVAFGILNTLFMSLFERNYEFGILRAIGTKDREIFYMVTSEAFALSLLSSFIGIIIASLVGFYWMHHGLDYSGIEFGEVTFTEKIYFQFSLHQFIIYPFALCLFTIFISLYPSWRLLKTKPAQSLHRTL